jgi:hypothetical protein
MHRIDRVLTIADDPKASPPSPIDQPRKEVGIVGAPDEMRPQRCGVERSGLMRPEYGLFRQSLAVRIVAKMMLGVRGRLVDPGLMRTVEGDAGAAAMHQDRHPLRTAGINDMSCAQGIYGMICIPIAPDAGDRGAVDDGIDTTTSICQGARVSHIS